MYVHFTYADKPNTEHLNTYIKSLLYLYSFTHIRREDKVKSRYNRYTILSHALKFAVCNFFCNIVRDTNIGIKNHIATTCIF